MVTALGDLADRSFLQPSVEARVAGGGLVNSCVTAIWRSGPEGVLDRPLATYRDYYLGGTGTRQRRTGVRVNRGGGVRAVPWHSASRR